MKHHYESHNGKKHYELPLIIEKRYELHLIMGKKDLKIPT
jgi:hypothetical protein